MRAARTDGNHQEIMRELRKAGIAVRSLAAMGDGLPDLLCAFREVTVLLEVKDGALPPSERKLTAAEIEFFATWPGKAYVVTSPEEAVRVVVEAARPTSSALSVQP
jgi:Holliday junction resolvase